MVDVEVWSHEPAKAAMLANALANAYLAESKSTQSADARRATSDLSGRLKELQQRLRTAGFNAVLTPLTEFLKAGGTAKCLTLKLSEP